VNLDAIVAELKSERDRLGRAIAALAGAVLPANSHKSAGSKTRVARRRMSAAARKRISMAMKKRWADQKKRSVRP
jgi:hypothetical protein